jgi:hypothetical protein
MVKGRLNRAVVTATSYAWPVWHKGGDSLGPRLMWVSPCRKGSSGSQITDHRASGFPSWSRPGICRASG